MTTPSSFTYYAAVGTQRFKPPFPVEATTDCTITINGVAQTYTLGPSLDGSRKDIILNTPVAAAGPVVFPPTTPIPDAARLGTPESPIAVTGGGGGGTSTVELSDSTGLGQNFFKTPRSEGVPTVTSLSRYFTDDFGGTSLNLNQWDDLNGGLPAVVSGVQPAGVSLPAGGSAPTFAQNAIGTGTSGITYAVAASALTFTMGTTNGSERWLLSRSMFSGSEDILVVLSRSQALAANSFFIGLVEVDPASGVPLLNPNLAQDFTNRGGVEFATSTGASEAILQGVSDSSPSVTSVTGATFSPAAMTTAFETLIQVRAEDIHAQSAAIDSSAAKTSYTLRLSSQVPNDTKVYKLVIRAKNVAAPASSTTFTISRIMVQDHQAMNVSISDAPGGQTGSQGLPVNFAGSLPAGSNAIGAVYVRPTTSGGATPGRILGSATGVLKALAGQVYGWSLLNTAASARFLHIYAKTTAPTVGTDTPVITIPLAANGQTSVVLDCGAAVATGLAWAITTDDAAIPATAGAAGDVVGTVFYA